MRLRFAIPYTVLIFVVVVVLLFGSNNLFFRLYKHGFQTPFLWFGSFSVFLVCSCTDREQNDSPTFSFLSSTFSIDASFPPIWKKCKCVRIVLLNGRGPSACFWNL